MTLDSQGSSIIHLNCKLVYMLAGRVWGGNTGEISNNEIWANI